MHWYGMDMVWMWYGCGMDVVWIWYGYGMDMVWICRPCYAEMSCPRSPQTFTYGMGHPHDSKDWQPFHQTIGVNIILIRFE